MKNKSLIMKFTIILLVFTITLLITSCGGNPYTPDEPTVYVTVNGRVIDLDNFSPVSHATVIIDGQEDITDSNGQFSISGIAGNQKVYCQINKTGYITKSNYIILSDNDETIYLYLKNTNLHNGFISGSLSIVSSPQAKETAPLNLNNKTLNILPLKPKLNKAYLPQYKSNEILVKFKTGINTQTLTSNETLRGTAQYHPDSEIYKIKAPEGMKVEELYNYYMGLDSVESVSYNYIGQLLKIPNDPAVYHGFQWYLDNINLPAAWEIFTGSQGVTVAVIDTGYLPHPDLMDNIDTSIDYDFVDNDFDAIDRDAYYNNSNDYRVSHGTHVAGIIGAIGHNNRGVVGTNWEINIMPLRIFRTDSSGNQYFETADLVDAIYYAVDNGANIINLSLAYISENPLLPEDNNFPFVVENALEYAYNNKVTVIAAAGNDNKYFVYYPASSDYTIAVGASDYFDQLTDYSNYGNKLDLIAPGGDLFSDLNGDNNPDSILNVHGFYNSNYYQDYNYLWMDGTSMAAPQVAGVAALLVAQGINNPDEIKTLLTSNASNVNGYKLLNARSSLAAAVGQGGNPYQNIIIIAATLNNNTDTYEYYPEDIAKASSDGSYTIPNVAINDDIYVFAWEDIDGSEDISNGDFFGEYENNPVNLSSEEHLENIDIVLREITGTTALSYRKVQLLTEPK
jgi:serine protease